MSTVCPDAPPDLAAVVDKALKKEKAKRYQTAQELARDVGDYLSGKRVTAYRYSTFELLQRFVLQNKAAVLVGSIGLVLLGVLGVASYQRVLQERDIALEAKKSAVEERDRSIEAERQAEKHFGEALSEKAQLSLNDGDRMNAEVFVATSLAAVENPVARGLLLGLYSDQRPKLVWESATPRLCMNITFSPDGTRIFCPSKQGIHAYGASRGTLVQTLDGHDGTVNALAFSMDGGRMFSGGRDNTIKIWDLNAAKVLDSLQVHTDRVTDVAINADGSLLLASSRDQTISLWDAKNGTLLTQLKGHRGRVQSVDFHPRDPDLAVSSGSDTTIRLWDVTAGRELKKLITGHQGTVYDVVFAPSGEQLASVSVDRTARLWDVQSGQEMGRLEGHEGDVLKVDFSPNGRLLATASTDRTARLWDVDRLREVRRFQGTDAWVTDVSFSSDSRRLVVSRKGKPIRLWDLDVDRGNRSLQGHAGPVNDVSLSLARNKIFTASDDKTVRIWNPTSKKRVFEIDSPTGEVWSVAQAPDGRFFAFGTAQDVVHIVRSSGNRFIKELPGYSVAISPAGDTVVTSSLNGKLRFFDAGTFEERKVIDAHSKGIPRLTFSPSGALVATAGLDNVAKIWDAKTFDLVAQSEHKAPVLMVAFSATDDFAATSTSANDILLWQVATKQRIGELEGHQNRVYALDFSDKGRMLASGSDDGKVKSLGLARRTVACRIRRPCGSHSCG